MDVQPQLTDDPHMDDGERRTPALSTRMIVMATLVVVLVAVASLVTLLWTFRQGTDQNKTQLDAVRAALSIALGTGGLAALLLAAIRQQTSEQVAADTRHDATERRVTELYTKAAEQLGSDKAPVRLAGLYALERLAESNAEHRRTIVNVLCAYLRMPYIPPREDRSPQTRGGLGIRRRTPAYLRPRPMAQSRLNADALQREELQVRLTAQRILADHLRPYPDDQGRPTNPKFWGTNGTDIDLDLTGATLIDLDLSGCRLGEVRFAEAQFVGWIDFSDAKFTDGTSFRKASFGDYADFESATFQEVADFNDVRFHGSADFVMTKFESSCEFDGTRFAEHARFSYAKFCADAGFWKSQFASSATFAHARFTRYVTFEDATFARTPDFDTAWAQRLSVDESIYKVRMWPSGWTAEPVAPGVKPSDLIGKWERLTLKGDTSKAAT